MPSLYTLNCIPCCLVADQSSLELVLCVDARAGGFRVKHAVCLCHVNVRLVLQCAMCTVLCKSVLHLQKCTNSYCLVARRGQSKTRLLSLLRGPDMQQPNTDTDTNVWFDTDLSGRKTHEHKHCADTDALTQILVFGMCNWQTLPYILTLRLMYCNM